MGYLNPRVLDYGLEVLVRGTSRLALTSEEPTDYETANDLSLGSTYTPQALIGDLPGLVVGPSNALAEFGRKVTVGPIYYGWVAVEGIASHWCLIDDSKELLLASGVLSDPLSVVVNNAFTLNAFDIILPGA